jgi:hypothetical protein
MSKYQIRWNSGMCWFLQLVCRRLCHLYRCLGGLARVHLSMIGPKLLCSMGLVGVGDAQVIGLIPYPGPQGCVPCPERSALCRDRQILLTWQWPANWEAKVCWDRVVLAVGIWYCTNALKELWCGGASHDPVQ